MPRLWLALSLTLLALPAAAKNLAFNELLRFDNSQIRQREQLMLTSQPELLSFWKRHTGQNFSIRDLPPHLQRLDFSKQWLLAIIAGEQPSSGYQSCVASIEQTDTTLEIRLQQQAPPADSFVALLPSSPGCLISLPAQPKAQIKYLLPTLSNSRIPLPMRTLALATTSQILTPRYIVSQDADSFRQLWREHAGSIESMPSVDFHQEMVIAVFMGEQPSGGYSIQIENVEEVDEQGHHLQVNYRLQRPDPSQMVIQMLTSPVHFIAVPRQDLAVEFKEN